MAVNGGSSVQLTTSDRSSAGLIVYKKPIKVVDGNPPIFPSFLRFSHFHCPTRVVMVWLFLWFRRVIVLLMWVRGHLGLHTSKFMVVVVEFDTSFDPEYGDLNGNHVGIDIDSLLSVKFCNISS
ncbi:hypothetical protein LWI28_016107 [Acer negundo]|uniref:Legume lectin domain-containing protein n=1 Tax=Acer negundo TaxID=4023 RepID=A0AAD5IJJ0_ACENE|nr:hypothetical protein LWI28_016107 [Acer negundo]